MNFVRCSRCGLRHSERSDRRCPRCRAELDATSPADEGQAPYRPPSASLAPPRSFSSFNEPDEETISLGARIAGVVLILNALTAFYTSVVLQVALAGPSRSTSAVVDLILGGLLVLGQRKVVQLCIVRVVLGALLFLGLSIQSGDAASAVMQLALSGSLLGLLLGRPGSARLGLSSVVAAAYMLFAGFGLHLGTRARSAEALLASKDIEVIGEDGVQGVAYDYRFDAPNPLWYVRSQAITKRENAVADQWLVRPDKDAHFIIIVESFGGQAVNVADYQDAVLGNLKNAASRVEVLETGQLFENYEQSRRVRARAAVMGMSIDYTYGLVVFGDQGYQFIGFAGQGEFPSVASEFQHMFDTLVIGEK